MIGCNAMELAMDNHSIGAFLSLFQQPSVEEHPSLKTLRTSAHCKLQSALSNSCFATKHLASMWSSLPIEKRDTSYDVGLSSPIVCIHGRWSESLPLLKGVRLFTLSSLHDPYTTAFHSSWNQFHANDKDFFSLLASASYQDALFIDIPDQTAIDKPLHILYLVEPTGQPQWTMPRLHISLGARSSLHIIESFASTGFMNVHRTIEVQEGACLTHTCVGRSVSSAICSSLHANIKKDGALHSLNAISAPFSRHMASITLQERGSSVSVNGLCVLPPHQASYVTINIDHQAEQTSSSQLFKGLVFPSALGSFESQVLIRKRAQQSSSRQFSHFLSLGSSAQTFNKPRFDIYADDVTASHGATTGTVDEEALFFLTSRGLSVSEAQRHLVEGFCEDMLRKLPSSVVSSFSRCIDDTIGKAV